MDERRSGMRRFGPIVPSSDQNLVGAALEEHG
jgi:hypothetical protein